MRILFLTEGLTVPAARFRVGQFVPHFEAAGIECVVRHAYGARYNDISQTHLGPAYALATRLRRAVSALDAGSFDLVFVQRPALPFTALPERWVASRNPRVIFDVDDAIWLGGEGLASAARLRTFHAEIALARHIVAGNRYLAERAGAPGRTSVIPTVIDTATYVPGVRESRARVRIGWMGTRGNFLWMKALVAPLKALLARRADVELRIVSNGAMAEFEGVERVEQVAWSAASEVAELQQFDIGLMPLGDIEVSRGKCGFKIIQYMAVGASVVASAVGANVEIMEGSGAGTLVHADHEWEVAIEALVDDSTRRAACGVAGRARAVAEYSIDAVLPRYLALFAQIAQS
jgi:glycosyltransferase involved in cell wall biosynthesis